MKFTGLSPLEISKLIPRANKLFKRSYVSKISEPDETSISLITNTGNIIISVHPRFPFFSSIQKIKSRGVCNSFCMVLRKYIKNKGIELFEQSHKDKSIFRILFSNKVSIIIDLEKGRSNIFLVDEDDVILGSHHFSRLFPVNSRYELVETGIYSENSDRFTGFNEVADFFLSEIYNEKEKWLKGYYFKELKKKRKKIERNITALERDGEKLNKMINNKRLGDLYLIVQWSWPKNSDAMKLDPALDGGEPVELSFPKGCKSPVQASQYYYRLYKKGKRGLIKVDKRRSALQKELSIIENKIENKDDVPLGLLEKEYGKYRKPFFKNTKNKKRELKERKPYRLFISEDKTPIMVGRSAKDNHILTFKIAKGNDYWFHIRNFRGSHVIVSTKGELKRDLLLDAATLALFYSDARKESSGEVIYTQKKYLRSVKGQPGKAIVSKSNTISIVVEEARISRLFASSKIDS